jgi:hypothetical protein
MILKNKLMLVFLLYFEEEQQDQNEYGLGNYYQKQSSVMTCRATRKYIKVDLLASRERLKLERTPS